MKISTLGRSVTSVDELARELEHHPLGAVVGDLFGDVESLASASRTSRTSTSGAEAPAVRPTVVRLTEPIPVDVGGALDQPRGNPHPLCDFGKAKRVAAVGCSDDEHPLALVGDCLDRGLPVRGRVANILAARRADGWKARFKRSTIAAVSSTESVVWVRKARFARLGTRRRSDVIDRLDESDCAFGHLAKGPDHLRMTGMADEQDVATFLNQSFAPGGGP